VEARNSEGHSCGPEGADRKFFDALADVFDDHPGMLTKYAVSCVDHETDIMKIDLKKRVEISRIEGERIISVFGDRGESAAAAAGLICCKWWRSSDNTWECLRRWDHAITGEPDPERDTILEA
jgi:hypothetical protein